MGLSPPILIDDPSLTITSSFPYVIYKYDIVNFYETVMSPNNTGNTELTDAQLRQSKSFLALMGFSWDYTLRMPGEIFRSDVGEISNGVLRADFIDVIGSNHAYVESRVLDAGSITIIVAVISVIAVAAIIFLKKKPAKKVRKKKRRT